MSFLPLTIQNGGTNVGALNFVNFKGALTAGANGGKADIDLALSGVTAGTYNSVTVDAYGRVTAATTTTSGGTFTAPTINNPTMSGGTITSTTIASSSFTGPSAFTGAVSFDTSPTGPTPSLADNSTKFATTAWVKGQNYLTGNQSISISGDGTGSGTTSIALTLATVNTNVGSFGSTTVVPVLTVNGKGLVTAVSTATITPAGIGAIATTAIGYPNGVAGLDATGKVPTSQLPASVLGAMEYQTTWDASANTPVIPVASVANKGYYYKVSVAGSTAVDGTSSWAVGDWIVSNGTTWDKVDNTEQVSSVFGRTGAIVANTGDYAVAQITGAAPLASPTFTGTPLSTTPSTADNSTKIATTAYVKAQGYLTANQAITVSGDATGSGTTAITLTLSNSGVTAGTYKSVTVDVKGRVTGGTNPTTLSGYGITNAQFLNRTVVNTATYTAGANDYFLGVNRAGPVTITLPTGVDNRQFIIKDESGLAGTNNITIQGTSQTIDGQASITINMNYGALTVYFGGSEFHIV